jgi:hypothetical protein
MTVPVVTAPFLAAAVLLGFAGAAKIVRPGDTARALRLAGLPASRTWVRAGALGEAAVACAALAVPGPVTGALVAGSYAAFTGFVVVALRRRWPLSSCGCFGKPDTPPTRSHAALNAGASLCAVWWSASVRSSVLHAFVHQNWQGSVLALETVVVALLAFVVWTNPLPAASGRSSS